MNKAILASTVLFSLAVGCDFGGQPMEDEIESATGALRMQSRETSEAGVGGDRTDETTVYGGAVEMQIDLTHTKKLGTRDIGDVTYLCIEHDAGGAVHNHYYAIAAANLDEVLKAFEEMADAGVASASTNDKGEITAIWE